MVTEQPTSRPVARISGPSVIALALGVLGLALAASSLSVGAVALGHLGRHDCKATRRTGGDLATAGLTLGWLHLGLVALRALVA
ncbi:DUF4190 domain-containing protein [Micromonospora globbae]|uniref:DUF4190 domain-containing protein n=1 Tax=Micromonospora globbae TaxID=1894969 RepID=UPI0038687D0D